MGSDLVQAVRLVDPLFSDNESYLDGFASTTVTIPLNELEAQGAYGLASNISKLATESARTERDERSITIEAQTRQPVFISCVAIGLILPLRHYRNAAIIEAIRNWGISRKLRTYRTIACHSNDSILGQIYQQVFDLYEDLGYFK